MRTPNRELKTDLKKGSWSLEEDQMLISYISRYGIWNWSQMPRFAGLSRSGKSCRLRWMNYLKPNIKRGNFSKEEEEIILHFHSLLGNRWSAIASRLPGRTDNEVKNYWHAHLKKRVIPKTTDQSEDKISVKSELDNVEKIIQPIDDQSCDISVSCLTAEDDIFSPSSTITSSKGYEVEFSDNYHDVGSPGTIDDLQCFWQQLCPLENLELEYNHLDIFSNNPTFQDSYDHDSNSIYAASTIMTMTGIF